MSNFLSDASSQALSHLQSGEAPTHTSVSDAPPAPATTDPSGTIVDPATPELKSQTYKVKIAGEETDVALEELLKGYSRTGDYTRKSMTLAQERKAFDDERKQFDTIRTQASQREAAIAEFLRDKNQVKQYYEYLSGEQLTPAQQQQLDASSPQALQHALAQQQQAIDAQMSQRMAQMQQMTQQELAKVQSAVIQRHAQELATDIDKTITGLLNNPDFADLRAVDDIAEILCSDAMKLNPQNIAEAKQAILQVAEMRADKLKAHYQEMLKASAVKQTKLTTQGIEPPGGSGVTPQPNKHKLGSKGLTNAAIEWMNAQNQK